MRDVYLATAPEVYIPVFVVFLIGAFRKSIFLVLLSVLLLAAAASIFIGPPAQAADDAAPAADAILAPATGTVTTLDCLRPLGYARIKIASKKTDTYARLAPMDGLLTEIEPGPATESAESAERLFQLDTATGRFTMTFSAARPSHIVPLLQTDGGAIAVHRGDPIAVVKWGGETTVEFPLRNVHIATDLGAQVQAGGAMGHIQAVWV